MRKGREGRGAYLSGLGSEAREGSVVVSRVVSEPLEGECHILVSEIEALLEGVATRFRTRSQSATQELNAQEEEEKEGSPSQTHYNASSSLAMPSCIE
jgi:hypothetical protein